MVLILLINMNKILTLTVAILVVFTGFGCKEVVKEPKELGITYPTNIKLSRIEVDFSSSACQLHGRHYCISLEIHNELSNLGAVKPILNNMEITQGLENRVNEALTRYDIKEVGLSIKNATSTDWIDIDYNYKSSTSSAKIEGDVKFVGD
jgi:hypothetical protein